MYLCFRWGRRGHQITNKSEKDYGKEIKMKAKRFPYAQPGDLRLRCGDTVRDLPDPSGRALTKVGNILISARLWDLLHRPLFISSCRRCITLLYVRDDSLNPWMTDSICKKKSPKTCESQVLRLGPIKSPAES